MTHELNADLKFSSNTVQYGFNCQYNPGESVSNNDTQQLSYSPSSRPGFSSKTFERSKGVDSSDQYQYNESNCEMFYNSSIGSNREETGNPNFKNVKGESNSFESFKSEQTNRETSDKLYQTQTRSLATDFVINLILGNQNNIHIPHNQNETNDLKNQPSNRTCVRSESSDVSHSESSEVFNGLYNVLGKACDIINSGSINNEIVKEGCTSPQKRVIAKKKITKPLPKKWKFTRRKRRKLLEEASKRKFEYEDIQLHNLSDNAMASADVNPVHTVRIHDLPRRILRKKVAELLPQKGGFKLSSNAMRTILMKDPSYRPPENKDGPVEPREKSRRLKQLDPAREVVEKANPMKSVIHPVKRILTPYSENFPNMTAGETIYKEPRFKERLWIYKSNKALDHNGIVIVAYLHHVMFEILPEAYLDSLQVSEYALGHHNVVKLLQHHVRKLLDQCGGTETNKRQQLLGYKQAAFDGATLLFQDNEENSLVINECIDLLVAEKYPTDLIPTPSDFLRDPSVLLDSNTWMDEFRRVFIKHMLLAVGFSMRTPKTFSQISRQEEFISLLLVECVRSFDAYVGDAPYDEKQSQLKPGDRFTFPASVLLFFKRKPHSSYLRNKLLWKFYRRLREDDAHVETKIFDVIPAYEKLTTELLRDFSNAILFSDEMLSITKYILIEHTFFIPVGREEKLNFFDVIVKKMYHKVFEILSNNWSALDMFGPDC